MRLAGIDYEWPCHLAPRERWCETARPNRRNPHRCVRSGAVSGIGRIPHVFHRREKPNSSRKERNPYE
jgi:hypothetical protein